MFEIKQKVHFGQRVYIRFPALDILKGMEWNESHVWKITLSLPLGSHAYSYIIFSWDAPKVFLSFPFLSCINEFLIAQCPPLLMQEDILQKGHEECTHPPREVEVIPKSFPLIHDSWRSRMGMVILGKKLLPGGKPSSTLYCRMAHALSLYRKLKCEDGHCLMVIFSGGIVQRDRTALSEAQVMKDIFMKDAHEEDIELDHRSLLKENRSQNTIENLVNSRTILEERYVSKFYLVTSNYHMPRAMKLAEFVFSPTHFEIIPSEDKPPISDEEMAEEKLVEQRALEQMELLVQHYSNLIDDINM